MTIKGLNQSGDTTWIDSLHKDTAEFVNVEYGATSSPVTLNTSGITPLAFKVLILPDPVEEVTKGGIIRPVEVVTKDEFATTTGTLIAASPAAFGHITEEEWAGTKPKPGERVVFTKYAGFRRKGEDGVDYLIVKDEDIHARID